jgi:hypothetical protein
VKKIPVAIVQCVPSAFFDEEMEDDPHWTGFFPCFCCKLRYMVLHNCSPNSESCWCWNFFRHCSYSSGHSR